MAITLNGTTGITTPDVDSTDLTATGNFTSRGIDDNATSTAMTLDASGNLLVGQTSANSFNLTSGFGFDVRQAYGLGVAVQDNPTAIFNRTNSDGTIAEFRKDGSTVGSIGSIGGDIFVGTGDTTLRFYDAGNAITPRGTNGAGNNGVIDLGGSSERFKDLYLSGGVYLGGTGSANKLDDYEEGTWTPELAGSTTAGTQTYFGSYTYARYRKVGSLVVVSGTINLLAFDGATAGDLHITNLPFTPVMGSNVSASGVLAYGNLTSPASDSMYVIATNALSYLRLRVSKTSGASVAVTASNASNNTSLIFSVSYYV